MRHKMKKNGETRGKTKKGEMRPKTKKKET